VWWEIPKLHNNFRLKSGRILHPSASLKPNENNLADISESNRLAHLESNASIAMPSVRLHPNWCRQKFMPESILTNNENNLASGGGGRTHSLRFWRPSLYQLSYTLFFAPAHLPGRIFTSKVNQLKSLTAQK